MGVTNLDSLKLSGDLTVLGDTSVTGLVPASGPVDFDDDVSVDGDLDVTGALTLGTPLAAAEIGAMAYETLNFFLSGGQSTGTLKGGALVGIAGTIVDVRARILTAPVGSTFIVDVNKNGTTIFTTQANRPTVADGENVSSTTAPDVTAVAAGDYLSVDVDQIGSGTAGSNLLVSVTIKRALV